MGSIDQIVLRHDRRGMASLAAGVSKDAYGEAAAFLLERYRRVLILTGFYVSGTIETDGPPGAIAIARAIEALGGRPTLVSDRYATPILRAVSRGLTVEEFDIADRAESQVLANALIARIQPTLIVSVERCGETDRGRYLNMHGEDISPYTASLDALVRSVPSIAIGDGGNEIGMGNIDSRLRQELGILEPCHTRADHLLLAAVSNWGALGLIAALEQLSGTMLLPSADAQHNLLLHLIAAGTRDGVTGRCEPSVDGFGPDIHHEVIRDLRALVAGTRSD
jgi:hypothetical protein